MLTIEHDEILSYLGGVFKYLLPTSWATCNHQNFISENNSENYQF